jgi:hypothetical protein
MALASGVVGPSGRFAVIDTENKRSRHYADDFNFDVVDLTAPYTAKKYKEAAQAAHKAGYGAIIIDSGTHEHEGEGGYLDYHDQLVNEIVKRRMDKTPNLREWEVREKAVPAAWNEPKRERKHMIEAMLACSTSTPIIFCFRAEEKVFKSVDGKLVAQNPPVWTPSTGKAMPYEMTVSLMLDPERPGYILKVLKMAEKLKHIFPLDKRIGKDSGKQIAEWSKGTNKGPAPLSPPKVSPPPSESTAPVPSDDKATPEQVSAVIDLLAAHPQPKATVDKWLKGGTWETLTQARIQFMIDWLKALAKKEAGK